MNTTRKEVKRVQGEACDHVFLVIGSETIRSARSERPDTKGGKPVTAKCPIPRCGL